MDLGTWIGVAAGLALIVSAMASGGSVGAFFDLPSLGVVVGGTLAATLVNTGLGPLVGAVRVGVQAFRTRRRSPRETINQVIVLAARARKEGLVALEHAVIDDRFLARGIRLGVDGLGADSIRAILEEELRSRTQLQRSGHAIFRFMGTTAPGMGMVGTLLGLVQMLESLDDPATIGPSMALALITTLYGAILAFLLCLPLAAKLEHRARLESVERSLAIAGVESILRGDSSLVIRSKLEAFVASAEEGRDRRRAA